MENIPFQSLGSGFSADLSRREYGSDKYLTSAKEEARERSSNLKEDSQVLLPKASASSLVYRCFSGSPEEIFRVEVIPVNCAK